MDQRQLPGRVNIRAHSYNEQEAAYEIKDSTTPVWS